MTRCACSQCWTQASPGMVAPLGATSRVSQRQGCALVAGIGAPQPPRTRCTNPCAAHRTAGRVGAHHVHAVPAPQRACLLTTPTHRGPLALRRPAVNECCKNCASDRANGIGCTWTPNDPTSNGETTCIQFHANGKRRSTHWLTPLSRPARPPACLPAQCAHTAAASPQKWPWAQSSCPVQLPSSSFQAHLPPRESPSLLSATGPAPPPPHHISSTKHHTIQAA